MCTSDALLASSMQSGRAAHTSTDRCSVLWDMRNDSDVNALAAGFLRDLAFVQESRQKMFGYKRAAAVVLALEQPLTILVEPGGRLQKIPGIGPSSTRVILEVLATGESSTVEHAVDSSSQQADVRRRRALRAQFLSRAQVLCVLADPA